MNNSNKFWDEIYVKTSPKMLGICRRYISNVAIAEDVMQDAYLLAMQKIKTYKGLGSFEAWLRRIVVNSALMFLRNEKNRKQYSIENGILSELHELNDTNESDSRSVIVDANYTKEELLEAIDNLPGHHKLVFNMYVFDDFSHNQIAKTLNISEGTSKSHLARARKNIQTQLYTKAMGEKNMERKREKIAGMLLFILPRNWIDNFYKRGLRNYTIKPNKDLRIDSTLVNSPAITVKILMVSKYFIGMLFLASIVLLVVLKLPQESVNENDNVKNMQSIDILVPTPLQIKEIPQVEKKKVVIKKKIVNKVVITRRDTIRVK